MKKKIHIPLLIIFFVALNYGCKKNPFDYRTKYIGDYTFTDSWTSYNMAASPPTNSGIRETNGKIEYGEQGFLKVTFDNNRPDWFHDLQVDREGNLTENTRDVGKISRNSINYHNYVSGLGGGSTTNISGKKK